MTDTDLDNILESYKRGILCILKNGKLCSNPEHMSLAQAKTALRKVIAKERIEETSLYRQYFKGRTQAYANTRIEQLETTLQGLESETK